MEDSNAPTRKTEFQTRKYEGSKLHWEAFVDDIKAAIQGHSHSRDIGITYLFTDWPVDPADPNKYIVGPQFVPVAEPMHLENHPTATAKEKLEINKRIEAIRAINTIITRLKAKLMEIIQDRVSNEMISTFNALGSDPYLAYRWLCRNHGPESQGITEKISMCTVFIDMKMKTEERFSAFLAKFERLSNKIGCPEIMALTYLMSDRTKNVGNRQMLADRLMPHVEDCRKLSRSYKDTVAYLLSQDNDYHALNEDFGLCAPCAPKGNKAPAAARAIQSRMKDGSVEIICFNCGKIGHMSNECDQGYCGYCGRDNHNSDICRDRLSGKPANRGKPNGKKNVPPPKKHKKNKQDEPKESSPPPAKPNKKRVRFDKAKAKVQKVQKEESSEEESSEPSSEEEEAPRRKLKKITRRISNYTEEPVDPWDRKVRSLKAQSVQSAPKNKREKGPSKFIAVLDSGADESCTPHEEILNEITARYGDRQDTPDVTLRTASGHRLSLEAKGDLNEVVTDVLVSPDLDTTLISAKRMREKGIGIWIPPYSHSRHIGAVLIRDDGSIMGVADKDMEIDVRSIHDSGHHALVPDITDIERATMISKVRGVTKYTYGLGSMPIRDRVAFIQKTMMCCKKDLIFMASGAIDNFPVTPEQIKEHWQDDVCWMQGHMKKRKADAGQFEDLSELKEVLAMEKKNNSYQKENQNSKPVASSNLRELETRNLVIGHEVGTDIFGPLLGASIVTAVDKCCGYGVSQKLEKGKKSLAHAIGEIADLFIEKGHPIVTLKSDSEAAYIRHMIWLSKS